MPRNLTLHVCPDGRGRLAAIVLSLIAAAACPAVARQMTAEQTVLVLNDAKIDPKVLFKAEVDVRRIFQEAGIQIRWLDCLPSPGECPRVVDPSMLVLHIAPARGGMDIGPATGLAILAREGGIHAYVFYDQVERRATPEVKAEVILAHAVAHEIGHLLLCLNGHTPTGLMRGIWSAEELRKATMGFLVFSPEQAARMREEVKRRGQSQSGCPS